MRNSLYISLNGQELEVTLDRSKANAYDFVTSRELDEVVISSQDVSEVDRCGFINLVVARRSIISESV